MEFSTFGHLPAELRQKIWQMTVQDATLRFTVQLERKDGEVRRKIKVQRLTDPCHARLACQEANRAIRIVRKDCTFIGICGEMEQWGETWKITQAPEIRLDPGRDTIYLVDPSHLGTFSVLAFAYPGLCKTTTAIALAIDSMGVSRNLASPCKYFPFSRKVTLVVIVSKQADVTETTEVAAGQLNSHLATCSRACTEFMRVSYATDFAEHREIALYVSGCCMKDIMGPIPDKVEFCGSYNFLRRRSQDWIYANIPELMIGVLTSSSHLYMED